MLCIHMSYGSCLTLQCAMGLTNYWTGQIKCVMFYLLHVVEVLFLVKCVQCSIAVSSWIMR